ncbi:HAD family hydrolase [bacterium]|nr:HAD family hydrolase [bacterium]
MQVKSIIFDMDGTLLDTLDIISRTNNRILQLHGFPTHPLDEYRNFVGDGMRMLLRRALPEGTGEDVITALLPEVLDLYHEEGVGTIPPYSGIRETLTKLIEKGVKISILTNKEHKYALLNAETILGEFHFDAILGERPGKPLKPAPYGIFEIAEITKVPLSQTVYAGDMKTDILTAKNAGVTSAGCLWGFGRKEDLTALGADFLISKPEELLDLL